MLLFICEVKRQAGGTDGYSDESYDNHDRLNSSPHKKNRKDKTMKYFTICYMWDNGGIFQNVTWFNCFAENKDKAIEKLKKAKGDVTVVCSFVGNWEAC